MSAQNISVLRLNVIATANITARRFVTVAGAVAGAGVNALGVAFYGDVSGRSVPVDVLGTAIVESGTAVAKGAALQSDASGRAITKDAGATLGRALQAATAAGQFIEIVLIPN